MNETILLLVVMYFFQSFKEVHPCSDKKNNCKTWKLDGMCEKRKNYMEKVCKRTCLGCMKSKAVTTECKDYRKDCRLLSQKSWCQKRRTYMQRACGVSCNFCQERKPALNVPRHVARDQPRPIVLQNTQQTKNPYAKQGCQDRRNDCAKFKTMGRCQTNEKAMSYFCKQTCSFCEMNNHIQTLRSQPRVQRRYTPKPSSKQNNANTCADKSENCKTLVEYGWCLKRKAYMKNLCSEACGFCGNTNRGSNTVRWVAPTRTVITVKSNEKVDGTCTDELRNCPQLKNLGWCEKAQSQMKTKCKKTCEFCTPRSGCVDKRTGCSKMKKLGLCATRKTIMKSICQNTCELCKGDTVETGKKSKDGSKPKEVVKNTHNCRNKFPTARCEYYSHMGWCNKNGQIRNNCYNTCVCNQVQSETTKKPNILVCKDDQRFDRLCSRFGSDCSSTGSLGKSLRRYCPKTCNICSNLLTVLWRRSCGTRSCETSLFSCSTNQWTGFYGPLS